MRKIDLGITLSSTAAILLPLDHFRIHGYWYDAHDLLLRTDSGLGFDSHEFFFMVFACTAIVLTLIRATVRRRRPNP